VLEPRGGHFFPSAAGKKISVSADWPASRPKKKTESQRTGRPAKKKPRKKIHGSGQHTTHTIQIYIQSGISPAPLFGARERGPPRPRFYSSAPLGQVPLLAGRFSLTKRHFASALVWCPREGAAPPSFLQLCPSGAARRASSGCLAGRFSLKKRRKGRADCRSGSPLPHPGGREIPAGSPRAIGIASLLLRKDQMKDPRKSWGPLSDTCHRELVNSSLSKAKCFNITTLIPRNCSRSSLPSDREQSLFWCHGGC
jgi:hypothetical protein